LKLNG
jgi:nicotinate dehydrogenase subunit A